MAIITRDQVTLSRVDDGESPVNVVIESSAGNIFKNGNISSILTCKVYKGETEITSSCTSFAWSKKNQNGDIDSTWSRSSLTNIITISNDDVLGKAIFICEPTIPDNV